MLKLKLHYFGHLMRRANSLEKTLMLGKIEGRGKGDNRGWNGWTESLIQWTWVWASSGRQWRTEKSGVLKFMGSQRIRHDWVTEPQQHNSSRILSFEDLFPVSSQLLKCSVTQDKSLRLSVPVFLSVKRRCLPSSLPDTLFWDSEYCGGACSYTSICLCLQRETLCD